MPLRWLLTLILASLPLISFFVQHEDSRRRGVFKSFKKHWTCFYADWIFVFINALFLYSTRISVNTLAICFLVSIIFNFTSHYFWSKSNEFDYGLGHFYYKDLKKLNLSGYAHLIFSIIEMTIIFTVIFSYSRSYLIYFQLILFAIFGLLVLIGSLKMYEKITKGDLIVGITLILVSLTKLFIYKEI